MFWWTADLHFGHTNIIKYMNRPYKTAFDMDADFIERINKWVARGDVLILAGDITLSHHTIGVYENYINKLPGSKIILKGNHDYWLRKGKYIDHRSIKGTFIATSHYPMRSWNRSAHGSINLHGHSHGQLVPLRNQLDIGIDNAFKLLGEYRPFSFDDVMNLLQKRMEKSKWKYFLRRQLRKLERYFAEE